MVLMWKPKLIKAVTEVQTIKAMTLGDISSEIHEHELLHRVIHVAVNNDTTSKPSNK